MPDDPIPTYGQDRQVEVFLAGMEGETQTAATVGRFDSGRLPVAVQEVLELPRTLEHDLTLQQVV